MFLSSIAISDGLDWFDRDHRGHTSGERDAHDLVAGVIGQYTCWPSTTTELVF